VRGPPAPLRRGSPLWLLLALAAPAALAQTPPLGSDLPIEITADALEVEPRDQIATFSGNVDAVQGDLVLSADRLLVHYQGSEGDAADAPGGSIRLIEAFGNVFLSSPEETAQGDAGVYDVTRGRVTLEGSVVLTRDDNVIRGERLEYDVASGRSRIEAAVPAVAGGTPPERVRAIFMPEGAQAPEAATAVERDAPPAPAARSAPRPPGPKPPAPEGAR